MKIRVYKRIRDNAYQVLVRTTEWSQADVDLFREFGEPEVDVGVGDRQRFARVMTGFPVSASFSGSCGDDAESSANAWKDEVVERIVSAVESARQMKDGFSGEEIRMV